MHLNRFSIRANHDDMLADIQDMIAQGSKFVDNAKHKYFTKIGCVLSDPSTGTKKYWSLIKKILNKPGIPEIPPLLENDIFVRDFAEYLMIAFFFNAHL